MKASRVNTNGRRRAAFLEPGIVFEDQDILVLDKPAGVVVNRAQTVKGKTIQDWVEGYLGGKRGGELGELDRDDAFSKRSGLVHRLDKETSGLLIVAKSPKAFRDLQRQFKKRQIRKQYLALVHGKIEPKRGVIRASVSRNPFNRKKFGVFLGGKEAETNYKVIGYRRRFSLLELAPKTGRTHQIRVHLKHLGHPVVADQKYAGRKRSRNDRRWCPRQFLHASRLVLTHPLTGERMKFISPLPGDLKRALAKAAEQEGNE